MAGWDVTDSGNAVVISYGNYSRTIAKTEVQVAKNRDSTLLILSHSQSPERVIADWNTNTISNLTGASSDIDTGYTLLNGYLS